MENATEKARKVSESYTEQVQMITSQDLNGYGSGHNVTTAMVDTLCFRAPAYPNDTLVLAGQVTWVGNTSMEVCVRTMVEDYDGEKRTINKAYLVLVALDENERPARVPRLILENEEQRMEWELGERRQQLRNERRRINAG